MRIFLVTVVVSLFLSLSTFAQGYRAGLSLGAVTSQVDGDHCGGYNKFGPQAGIWVEHALATNWSARLDFRFIQKGAQQRDKNTKATTYKIHLSYFDLPISAAYKLSQKISARAGLSVGYLADAKEFDEHGQIPYEFMWKFRKFELSGLLGLGYVLGNHWLTEFMFMYSLIPISSENRHYGPYNNVMEMSILYQF